MKEFEDNIGKKVRKYKSNRPFKSGKNVNKVKGVIEHPILFIPAYTFFDDDSYVECRRCEVVETNNFLTKIFNIQNMYKLTTIKSVWNLIFLLSIFTMILSVGMVVIFDYSFFIKIFFISIITFFISSKITS